MQNDDWEAWERCRTRIERMAWRIAHGRPELYEWLRDAALERYPSIVAEFDESYKVPLDSWLMHKLRYIMTKRVGPWLRRRALIVSVPMGTKDSSPPSELEQWQEPETPRVDSDAALEVRLLLEGVDPSHRDIIVMRDMLGMTFTEIARRLNVNSHNTARRYYAEAMEAVRAQLRDR